MNTVNQHQVPFKRDLVFMGFVLDKKGTRIKKKDRIVTGVFCYFYFASFSSCMRLVIPNLSLPLVLVCSLFLKTCAPPRPNVSKAIFLKCTDIKKSEALVLWRPHKLQRDVFTGAEEGSHFSGTRGIRRSEL